MTLETRTELPERKRVVGDHTGSDTKVAYASGDAYPSKKNQVIVVGFVGFSKSECR
jgi:hypothetical protein